MAGSGRGPEHHFGGTYVRAVISYLERSIGAEGVDAVLRRAGETREAAALSDADEWSSYGEFRRLLEAAAALSGGTHVLTGVGRHLFDLSDFDRSPDAVQALGSPDVLFANASAASGMICPISRVESEHVGEREWLITQTFDEGYDPFPEHCSFQVGIHQFITTIFGYGPADVVEEQCAGHGAPGCVFRVRWEGVDEAARRADLLESRLHSLEALLERFESTVADLVTGPDLQTILSSTFASASRALQAPIFVLALHGVPENVEQVYFTGVSGPEAQQLAADLLRHDLTHRCDQLAVELVSTRGRYGRLAAIRPGGGFLPKEGPRLQAYASFLAAALDSAASLAEVRHQQAEASRQRDTAQALLQLSTALAEVSSVQEMAAKLVRAVPEVMGCERAVVILRDRDRTQARIAAAHGYPAHVERQLLEVQVPIPEHLPEQQLALSEFNRRPETVTDDLGAAVMRATGTAAHTVIPISVDGEWTGAIVASTVRDGKQLEPSPENESRLRALAAQASTAIRNSQLLDQVRHQALHDSLTGLPNRALILDRADQMLARARRNGQAPAALFVDLDGFKDINDTFGHAVGDELLRAITVRLQATVRPGDTVGRLGGDEFVVLVDGASLDVGPELVAERLLTVLREPVQLPDQQTGPLPITASIGIASGDRPNAGHLLRDADIALYQAKAAGKDQFRVFEAQMQTTIQDRLLLQMELRSALDQEQFSLVYQPICNLASGEITSVEALLRWEHPTRGQVQPNEFIPLLEETGLILDVGRWVLMQACRQGVQWHSRGIAVAMAVNVSGRQLQSERFLVDVREALARSGLDPAALIVEITESTMMTDVAGVAKLLRAVKTLGVQIAIDDFGTGYSSLSVLRDFPVDTLKIDRAFVSTLGESKDASALIHTLVQLGKTLGLNTLAEGIEEVSQYQQLQHQECDSGQGFLIARPMTADRLESVLFAGAAVPEPAASLVATKAG